VVMGQQSVRSLAWVWKKGMRMMASWLFYVQ
jgi:hypothetical protein